MSKKNILLIGVGNIGIYHLEAINSNRNLNVKIVDICEERVQFLNELMDFKELGSIQDLQDINQFDYVILCIPPAKRVAWLDLVNDDNKCKIISEKPVVRGKQIFAVPYLKQLDYNRTYLRRQIRNKIRSMRNFSNIEYSIAINEVSFDLLMDLYSHGLAVLMQVLFDVVWNLTNLQIEEIEPNITKGEVSFKLINYDKEGNESIELKIRLDNKINFDRIKVDDDVYAFTTPVHSIRRSAITFLINRFIYRRRDYIYDYFDEFYKNVFSNSFSELMDATIELDEKLYLRISSAV